MPLPDREFSTTPKNWNQRMSRIEDLQQEILNLSRADYQKLKNWLIELDWEEWDKQIEVDSIEGRLDSLINDAREAKKNGSLEPL